MIEVTTDEEQLQEFLGRSCLWPTLNLDVGHEAFRWPDAEASEDRLARFRARIDEVENGLESYEEHPHLAIVTEVSTCRAN